MKIPMSIVIQARHFDRLRTFSNCYELVSRLGHYRLSIRTINIRNYPTRVKIKTFIRRQFRKIVPPLARSGGTATSRRIPRAAEQPLAQGAHVGLRQVERRPDAASFVSPVGAVTIHAEQVQPVATLGAGLVCGP